MNHGNARLAIGAILEGCGFDARARALVLAARFSGDSLCSRELGERLMNSAKALQADASRLEKAPKLHTPLPASGEELARELAPLIVEHPRSIAEQLIALDHITTLWPHANREERARLRLNWLGSMVARAAPPASTLSRSQLREWQRNLPTIQEEGTPCATVLAGMLKEAAPEKAYATLSLYLGANADLPTLSWTLGVLAERVLLHNFDPQGASVRLLAGTVACERLVDRLPPETLITLISQLNHSLWWSAQQPRKDLRPSTATATASLMETVQDGDIYGAERAARKALGERSTFWAQVVDCLAHLIEMEHPAWVDALASVVVIRYRGGRESLLSPDDAATIGAALAGAQYRANTGSHRLAAV
jgi:hypothetical protein